MFSYYGSKSKIIHLYPKPVHDKIIEPFAGSARYALRYYWNDVLLVDKYQVIIDIWHYLQQASPKDILGLPTLEKLQRIPDSLSSVERSFMGFTVQQGCASPSNFAGSLNGVYSWPYMRNDIATNLFKIRHWKIIQGDYQRITNQKASWFIDPPYANGGEYYKHPITDYPALANWCLSRNGQIIVCENTQGRWLPFKPLVRFSGANNIPKTETIYERP